MLRIYTSNYVPKYANGLWLWNENEERLEFDSRVDVAVAKEEIVKTGGYKFLGKINQIEELIFRQEFQRPDTTHDADVILIQDIKNLVLFLSPSEFMTKGFVNFMHTKTIDRFLNALVIYFEYFLKMVEFVLIRRDEISGEKAQIQSEESIEIKRIYSAYLTQYRLLLAREYSGIVLGIGDMKPYYHIKPIVNISMSIRDKAFHESALAFFTQFVWISMHRRDYELIESEMSRLFRSEHFKLTRNERIQFSKVEASMLYGKNYKRVNYRAQNSPLIQELNCVASENLPILWIGERKYRGSDYRIHELELEYIVPPSQLSLIDVTHGILGHPKKLYNTMLTLNWEAVRFKNYSEIYDPYRIVRQPYLELPKLDAEKIRKHAERYQYYFQIINHHEQITKEMMRKWMRRDRISNYFKTEGMITDVWMTCEKEVADTGYGPSVKQIIKKFIAQKEKLRKNY